MTVIALDCRMVFASGNGVYIRNIIPALIQKHPEWSFKILGYAKDFEKLEWHKGKNVTFIPFEYPIYSVKEHIFFPHQQVEDADLLWSLNYNIPVGWKRKLLCCVHDVAHLALPDIYGGILKTTYAKMMMAHVRRRADGITFLSEFSKSQFIDLVGHPSGQTRIIHCGVSNEWSEPTPALTEQKKPYLVYVGNIKPHKNLTRLLDAFEILKDEIPHNLKIIGKKEGFVTGDSGIAQKIAKFGDRIDFTGFIAFDDLRATVRHADALVMPSLYEGFGLPPVEAMAAGCVSIVSDVASMPEICQDAAHYFSPYDTKDMAQQIKRVIFDEAYKDQLRKKGHHLVAKLTWEKAIDDASRFIQDLL